MKILRKIWEAIYYICGEGGWTLRAYEKLVVESAIDTLDSETQQTLRGQLSSPFFVERTNNRINVIRFYKTEMPASIENPNFDDAAINVKTKADGEVSYANVIFYKGFIFSIETRRPGKWYRNKTYEILSVKPENPSMSLTNAIDRLEHGRDS